MQQWCGPNKVLFILVLFHIRVFCCCLGKFLQKPKDSKLEMELNEYILHEYLDDFMSKSLLLQGTELITKHDR